MMSNLKLNGINDDKYLTFRFNGEPIFDDDCNSTKFAAAANDANPSIIP